MRFGALSFLGCPLYGNPERFYVDFLSEHFNNPYLSDEALKKPWETLFLMKETFWKQITIRLDFVYTFMMKQFIEVILFSPVLHLQKRADELSNCALIG